jgi:hypothetical protein
MSVMQSKLGIGAIGLLLAAVHCLPQRPTR